jgi:hypothetical protein
MIVVWLAALLLTGCAYAGEGGSATVNIDTYRAVNTDTDPAEDQTPQQRRSK